MRFATLGFVALALLAALADGAAAQSGGTGPGGDKLSPSSPGGESQTDQAIRRSHETRGGVDDGTVRDDTERLEPEPAEPDDPVPTRTPR